jgi:hypothetical protein
MAQEHATWSDVLLRLVHEQDNLHKDIGRRAVDGLMTSTLSFPKELKCATREQKGKDFSYFL